MNGAEAIIGAGIAAFLVAWLATGLVRRHALSHAILDIPNQRSSHATPTARGGGLAIAATFMAAVAVLANVGWLDPRVSVALIAGGAAVALTGYLDDRRTVPAGLRLAVHVGAAGLAVLLLGGIAEPALGHMGLHGVLVGGALALVAITWATNLFNFMDGIDGIAGSEAVFMAGAGALLNWKFGADGGLTAAMMMLGAATLGFLVWNWPPARIFMGDVGSGFLGFTLAVLALAASRQEPALLQAWTILGGVFLVDATVTLLRRMVRGDRWFEAHRLHAYQKLAVRWRAHRPVTLAVIAVDLFWLLPWAWVAASKPERAGACVLVALAPLVVAAAAAGAGGRAGPSAT